MKKRKSKLSAIGLLLLSLSGFASLSFAEPVASLPVQIPVSPESQVRVSFSNTEPNMLVVPGDRIVGIDSAKGMFINEGSQGKTGIGNGGVVLMTAQTKPFTFYVRTAGGLTVAVVAVPQKRDGRILQLVSSVPAKRPSARQWERSLPYPQMLIELHKSLLNGQLPQGFAKAPETVLPKLTLSAGYVISTESMWNGGELRVYKLAVRNTTGHVLPLTERLFSAQGVRAVLISPYSEQLLPGATATVWLTVSNEV
ncbi:type-F conjugative transfer system secretin TraK [Providencia rettgeri]